MLYHLSGHNPLLNEITSLSVPFISTFMYSPDNDLMHLQCYFCPPPPNKAEVKRSAPYVNVKETNI